MEKIIWIIAGGFIGAFFSYFFGRLKEINDRLLDKQITHLNALVIAERNIVFNSMVYSRNERIINGYIKMLQSKKFFIPLLHPYNIDRTIIAQIRNAKIVNKLANYINSVENMNLSFQQYTTQYNTIKAEIKQEIENIPEKIKRQRSATMSTDSDQVVSEKEIILIEWKIIEEFAQAMLNNLEQLIEVHKKLREDIIDSIAICQIAYAFGKKRFKKVSMFQSNEQPLPQNMKEEIEIMKTEIVNKLGEDKDVIW